MQEISLTFGMVSSQMGTVADLHATRVPLLIQNTIMVAFYQCFYQYIESKCVYIKCQSDIRHDRWTPVSNRHNKDAGFRKLKTTHENEVVVTW